MHRRMYALVVGAVLTLFAFLLLTGRYINDGPILLRISDEHGLHAGDLFVIAGWAAAMASLVRLTTSQGPVRSS